MPTTVRQGAWISYRASLRRLPMAVRPGQYLLREAAADDHYQRRSARRRSRESTSVRQADGHRVEVARGDRSPIRVGSCRRCRSGLTFDGERPGGVVSRQRQSIGGADRQDTRHSAQVVGAPARRKPAAERQCRTSSPAGRPAPPARDSPRSRDRPGADAGRSRAAGRRRPATSSPAPSRRRRKRRARVDARRRSLDLHVSTCRSHRSATRARPERPRTGCRPRLRS